MAPTHAFAGLALGAVLALVAPQFAFVLAVGVGYVLVRKPLAVVAEWVFERLPDPILKSLPERILPIEDSDLERIRD
ncbi:hypothetical protein [Natronococcus sp.]|uniref:hypothetical protein n=1 Tax=Natronococcus sp. TaxID=35747 RepID=UPI0025CECA61|nr:hypothetical protein [Natronococcus sp.]